MLKAKTQYNIRSDVLTLTRRHHTNLISQHLMSISCTFYTDMLFSKNKSIIGNTCDQIFMNGKGFIYVHPMQSKLKYGEVLNVATMNIGLPNTLVSENTGEQAGTEI